MSVDTATIEIAGDSDSDSTAWKATTPPPNPGTQRHPVMVDHDELPFARRAVDVEDSAGRGGTCCPAPARIADNGVVVQCSLAERHDGAHRCWNREWDGTPVTYRVPW